jgi:hypothetical protein
MQITAASQEGKRFSGELVATFDARTQLHDPEQLATARRFMPRIFVLRLYSSHCPYWCGCVFCNDGL